MSFFTFASHQLPYALKVLNSIVLTQKDYLNSTTHFPFSPYYSCGQAENQPAHTAHTSMFCTVSTCQLVGSGAETNVDRGVLG